MRGENQVGKGELDNDQVEKKTITLAAQQQLLKIP